MSLSAHTLTFHLPKPPFPPSLWEEGEPLPTPAVSGVPRAQEPGERRGGGCLGKATGLLAEPHLECLLHVRHFLSTTRGSQNCTRLHVLPQQVGTAAVADRRGRTYPQQAANRNSPNPPNDPPRGYCDCPHRHLQSTERSSDTPHTAQPVGGEGNQAAT